MEGLEMVNHPSHYGGADNQYEAIKVIEMWKADFCIGNAIKYISRAGKKNSDTLTQDLLKSLWYIRRTIEKGHLGGYHEYSDRNINMEIYKEIADKWSLPEELKIVLKHISWSGYKMSETLKSDLCLAENMLNHYIENFIE